MLASQNWGISAIEETKIIKVAQQYRNDLVFLYVPDPGCNEGGSNRFGK